MDEFLNRLYSYEYFGTYLLISIAVLILLFIIILFFGKKDQKNREIEATKKLQQINNEDAFKEDSLGDTVEVPVTNAENEEVLGNTISIPNLDSLNTLENDNNTVDNLGDVVPPINMDIDSKPSSEFISPFVKKEYENLTSSNAFQPEKLEDEINPTVTVNDKEPLLVKEEEKPLAFNSFEDVETPSVPEFDFNKLIKEIEESRVETVTNENASKENDEILNNKTYNVEHNQDIYSSVFIDSDDKEIEKEETNDNDEELDLPVLKKEVVEPKKEIELPSLNDLAGETYNIK